MGGLFDDSFNFLIISIFIYFAPVGQTVFHSF